MTFSLSFGGVQVRISPCASKSKDNANFSISSVRHCEDGHIEADVCNFSGTIIISEDCLSKEKHATSRDIVVHDICNTSKDATAEDCQAKDDHTASSTSSSREVIVDAIPEQEDCCPIIHSISNRLGLGLVPQASFLTANTSVTTDPYVPSFPQQNSQLTVEIDSDDDEEKKVQSPESGAGRVQFGTEDEIIEVAKPNVDLSLHEALEAEDADIDDLRELLRSKPHLASVQDEFEDYPAHVFARNDAFIYTASDYDVQQFAFELYTACPTAFLTEGYDGQIPFAGTIVDWVDDCHTIYSRDTSRGVQRMSEIKTMTKSTRVINSLCVRESVQRLTSLPTQVTLTPKVRYSFIMLSFILDTLSEQAFKDISIRREFWAVASKRREKIIRSMSKVPFIVRTILLIENKTERYSLIKLSIVRNLMFRPESVDLWLLALLSGDKRARESATCYLCVISKLTLSSLFGKKMMWSNADSSRFHSMREQLYKEVGNLSGFLPCMLHLGDSLYVVSSRRAVKYIVEREIGRPLPVYLMFMETILMLLLMTSYRIVVELVYDFPSQDFLSQYHDFWGLSLTIAVFFAVRDIAIMCSLSGTEEKLALRYARSFGNMVGSVTTASVIIVLSVLYVDPNIMGRPFVGIVAGLLWWKFLLHVKGMSESLSTLIYTIMQIAAELRYFLAVFLITIFFFADMVDIIKKTTGECEMVDGVIESDLEMFCSLTPLQSYLAMYSVMIGGFEISWLEGSSALVSLLFVGASFCGVIVLVNILIAIVTGEYEKAQQRSCSLFAKSRLEAAARHNAREKMINLPDDPTSGLGRKIARFIGKSKLLALVGVIEYFLIKSLISGTSLYRDGYIGDFLYVALIICAVLQQIFLLGTIIYKIGTRICTHDRLKWLRGSKFHTTMLKIAIFPVRRYLTGVGLGHGEKCPDAGDGEENDHPLSNKEYTSTQADFEGNIQEAIKESETRILHAVKSMMLHIPAE